MTGMLIVGAFVVLMGLLAARFGADTRDGRDWREEPDRDLPERGSPFPTLVSPY